jgi:hypothetical protein
MDNAGFLDNPKLRVLLEKSEQLLYADMIKKWENNSFFADTRILAVTTENIYNIKGDKI